MHGPCDRQIESKVGGKKGGRERASEKGKRERRKKNKASVRQLLRTNVELMHGGVALQPTVAGEQGRDAQRWGASNEPGQGLA